MTMSASLDRDSYSAKNFSGPPLKNVQYPPLSEQGLCQVSLQVGIPEGGLQPGNKVCPCSHYQGSSGVHLFFIEGLGPDTGSPLSHVGERTDDLALVIRELGAVKSHVEARGPSPGGVESQASIEGKWLGHHQFHVLSHGNDWPLGWSLGSVIP